MDIKVIADQLFDAFKQSILAAVATDAPDIIAAATSYITNGEKRLKDLAVDTIDGNLDYPFVIRRLKEETVTLKDALIGLEQMIASDIQQLVNNLIGIFENLLRSVILSLKPLS